MGFAEIEAELENLQPDELRRLALKSWRFFLQKEGHADPANECSEDNSALLAALDEAIAEAEAAPDSGYSATEVTRLVREWTSR